MAFIVISFGLYLLSRFLNTSMDRGNAVQNRILDSFIVGPPLTMFITVAFLLTIVQVGGLLIAGKPWTSQILTDLALIVGFFTLRMGKLLYPTVETWFFKYRNQ